MNAPLPPGLIVLQGNRLEALREVVVEWLSRHPPGPIEEEIFLVQSNAAADWLKRSLATGDGLCAAVRFELPGRFLWRMYRSVLGPRVAVRSALDRTALTWRLMRLLPGQLEHASFAPLRRFLEDGDPQRRLQLATRLADLYDQYQVYRGDWLEAWAGGRAILTSARGRRSPLPADQRWQAELWSALLDELGPTARWSVRPLVHRAFVDALAAGAEPVQRLPRRVVLFGASHGSAQGLEALNALAARMQVICAIPDPCRYHWADIVDGREALVSIPQRSPSRAATLADVPLADMHLHAHPLLAAWGRQGRDFMRLLDAFDATATAATDFARVDLFDDVPGTTLLGQVQAAVRDLVPLVDHPLRAIPAADRSIVFEIAHSAHREVEILHDRLLERLSDGDLQPRDIVVMVPDIATFAPSIRAVFGQYARDDARFVPFDIADLAQRGSDALIGGLDWLLRLPDQRLRLRELRDLLEIPAAAARAEVPVGALPGLFEWLAGAGVRWGLDEDHRARLGLGAAGTQNTWSFGLARLLMGYAAGTVDDIEPFAGIEPYDAVGGLEAAVVGPLSALLERLDRWLAVTATDATPTQWAARGRSLLDGFFTATDDRERLTIAALHEALAGWLDACAAAGFDERVSLAVLRESWLAGLDGLDAQRRFLGGGVTFCTLMPLRAVPFEVVCLLGMNDGDFPRAPRHDDFDLMTLAGLHRAGDRSRREDDRYLMLEALLSARRALHVSWRGRSIRDNASEPPSVLVSQLRDYLRRGWTSDGGGDVLATRTTEHPLQPFSRRYFEGGPLVTFAREWQAAHRPPPTAAGRQVVTALDLAAAAPLDLGRLERFLRNPVAAFFAARLDVVAPPPAETVDDDELFSVAGLDAHRLCNELLRDPDAVLRDDVAPVVAHRLARMTAAGTLPLFELGARVAASAAATATPILQRWLALRAAYPLATPKIALRFEEGGVVIDDWLDTCASPTLGAVWIAMTPSRLIERGQPRPDLLLRAWLRSLLIGVADVRATGVLIGGDVVLSIAPPGADVARTALTDLLRAWREGMESPLPFTLKTSLAALHNEHAAREVYEGSFLRPTGEAGEFTLRRTFPDFAALAGDPRFGRLATQLAEPLARWSRAAVAEIGRTTGGDGA